MKKIYLLAILAMGASSVFGQGKLDLRSLEVLRQYQAQTAGMQKTQAARWLRLWCVFPATMLWLRCRKRELKCCVSATTWQLCNCRWTALRALLHQMRCARCSSHVLCVRNLTKPTSRQAPTKCIKGPISTVHILERA